eukprot:g11649.t1
MLTTVLKRLPSRTGTSCVSGSTTASPVLSKLIDSNVCNSDFHEQMHLRVFRRGMAKKAKKRGKWATKKKTSEYVKKALADAENYEKRFEGELPAFLIDDDRQTKNKALFKPIKDAEKNMPHSYRLINRKRRGQQFTDGINRIKPPPLYEREDIFEWHQERIPGDIRKPIFTTRCGIENKDDKIMIMDKIFNDRVSNEGWNTVYNRYSNFRHNRGNFDKPSMKKRTERNKKIHSRDGKIAIKTLEYLQYLNESRAEQNERREKYMASFEQFGEVVEEEEDTEDESGLGASNFDFTVLGSGRKTSKVRYAPRRDDN